MLWYHRQFPPDGRLAFWGQPFDFFFNLHREPDANNERRQARVRTASAAFGNDDSD
jgi:hypothetical protein